MAFYLSFYTSNFSISKLIILCCLLWVVIDSVSAQLSPTFYSSSCPNATSTIQSAVQAAVNNESRMAASLLRLHFHDCFVNGCDGSLLLDDTANFTGEKKAAPNLNSVRGFEVVDTIKSQVEKICPGVVSCADILALAARDSVVALGGPNWTVALGRRDSQTANQSAANTSLPAPFMNLDVLTKLFSDHGFTTQELVALSGAHTIGLARCTTFRTHIYNETNINSTFASSMQANCPFIGGDNNTSPLDSTSTTFDNAYFSELLGLNGLLHSDQELFSSNGTGSTNSTVSFYSSNSTAFFIDFANAMVKMGNLSVLTGSNGEIRTNCRKVNSNSSTLLHTKVSHALVNALFDYM
ncbi:cationic peroxidase 1-like [Amaranthus tricolor]|uniref:cationic peroxidase 1-like n=1 Tax=Amaranthus tricolor TaxID=29722 RepID=UPI0025854B80|nr:cationic peroxidase 1-like [Amaranthus tricolor]